MRRLLHSASLLLCLPPPPITLNETFEQHFPSTYAQAIVLGQLIGYFDDEDSASWEGWTFACAVVIGGVLFR